VVGHPWGPPTAGGRAADLRADRGGLNQSGPRPKGPPPVCGYGELRDMPIASTLLWKQEWKQESCMNLFLPSVSVIRSWRKMCVVHADDQPVIGTPHSTADGEGCAASKWAKGSYAAYQRDRNRKKGVSARTRLRRDGGGGSGALCVVEAQWYLVPKEPSEARGLGAAGCL